MIRTIIFDIGGVLVGYDWRAFLLKEFNHDEEKVDRIRDAVFLHHNWDEVDRGVLPDEELLARFIRIAPDLESEIRQFWRNLSGALWQFDYTKDWIRSLKARGYQVLILSNWSDHVRKCCQQQLDFLPLVDGGIFSYKVHLIKPEPAIYHAILEKYHLSAGECVFLDDKKENVMAARECGLHTVHVTDHEKDVKELEALLEMK